MTSNCLICNREFKIYPYKLKTGRGKFCSRKCYAVENSRRFLKEKNPRWNGGKTTINGYILISKPDHPYASKRGYVLEHRLVMEEKLGRYLSSIEVVDHINHKRDDNRIENLRLYSSNSEHLFKDQQIVRFVKRTFGSLEGLQHFLTSKGLLGPEDTPQTA